MSVFTISDLHLSLNGDKSMEVFHGWEDYVDRIRNNWCKIVSDNDAVVIPGDISWEMKIDNAVKDFGFINELPGKKYIIKGNHDLWWTSFKKMNEFLAANGFSSIEFINNSAVKCGKFMLCGTRGWLIEESGTDSKLINREAMRLKASLDAGKKTDPDAEPIVFLHYPPVTEAQQCDELISVMNDYGVRRVYYGHLHGGSRITAVNSEINGISYRLVSADTVDFCPVLVL